ncbi:hypothetical protein BpHYR1_028835 [Brachionus plicatilis]|uniref:Uncharacterized protein n=1 Tax=Brachionus plicatilis TaxID=10195 RepID=A0A3M7PW23_BRAPC|nr:hypothetical protein BpHYR1_028835 [Brachionus plicatilis]
MHTCPTLWHILKLGQTWKKILSSYAAKEKKRKTSSIRAIAIVHKVFDVPNSIISLFFKSQHII